MSQIFPFSQAVSIAFRSMVAITMAYENKNIDIISLATGASRHHVAKVLQRLAQDGLIASKRGPGGGFFLRKKANEITLLDIYKSIEGAWLLDTISQKSKSKKKAPFDQLSDELSNHIISFLKSRKLSAYVEEQKLEH